MLVNLNPAVSAAVRSCIGFVQPKSYKNIREGETDPTILMLSAGLSTYLANKLIPYTII